MRLDYLLYSTVICVFTFGCASKSGDSLPTLSIICDEQCSVRDVFDNIEVIPLKNQGEPFFDGLDNDYLRYYGDYFSVKDGFRTLYLFDNEGNLVSDSKSRIGNGRGEYNILLGYGFNTYSQCFEVLTPLTMYVYDKDFRFKKTVKLPAKWGNDKTPSLFFNRIYDLSDHIHFLLPSLSTGTIFVFDSDSNEVIHKIDYSDDIIAEFGMRSQSFISDNNGLMFYPECFNKYVYDIDTTTYKLTPIYKVEGVKLEDKGSEKEQKDYYMNTTDELPLRYYHAGDNSMFLTKKGNSANDMYYIFYDANLTPKRIKLKKDGEYQLPFLSWSYGDSFYGLTDGDNIVGLMEKMGKECPDSLKEYPNIVVKYTVATSPRNF